MPIFTLMEWWSASFRSAIVAEEMGTPSIYDPSSVTDHTFNIRMGSGCRMEKEWVYGKKADVSGT
jgi:hypothetical protein